MNKKTLALVCLLFVSSVHAQILKAITGHANDIKARFSKETIIHGAVSYTHLTLPTKRIV